MDLRVMAYVFGVIFVAELPDKTAIAAVVLATRHKPLPVFVGSAVALTLQSAIAIAAGELLSLLPARAVHVGAGVLFLVSAVFMWRRKEEKDDDGDEAKRKDRGRAGFLRSAWITFGVVFIAELGDLTQLATAAMAARYKMPVTVFLGATAALWCVAAIAIFVGNRAAKVLKPEITQKVASVLFALAGIALVTGIL